MMRYVTDAENLKLMMVLLKETSKSIQFEAFHVFKVGFTRLLRFLAGVIQRIHIQKVRCDGTLQRNM